MDILRAIVTVAAFTAAVFIIGAATAGIGVGIAAIAGTLAKGTAIVAIMTHIVPIVAAGIYFGVSAYSAAKWDNEVDLPMYSLTPEAIFTNNIPLFDVNFFNTDEDNDNKKHIDYAWATKVELTDNIKKATYKPIGSETIGYTGGESDVNNKLKQENYNVSVSTIKNSGTKDETQDGVYYYYVMKDGIIRMKELEGDVYQVYVCKDSDVITTATKTGEGQIYSFSRQLSKLVSNWYFGLRMLAIVGMMSVLVYIGIRILLSSTSPQKAKYKQLLGDWLVGMVLLFTMHYIMSLANVLTEQLTEIFKSVNPCDYVVMIPVKAGANGQIENRVCFVIRN